MWIIRNKKIFITISLILMGLSIVALIIFGLNAGIDFKGGALTEIAYPEGRPGISLVQEKVGELEFGEILVQPTGIDGYFIKTKDLTEEERQTLFTALSLDGEFQLEEKSFTSIGPSVGKELKKKAIMALIVVIFAIILFIAYVFRKVSKPVSSWKYGLIAIFALIHDVLLTTGVFIIISRLTGAEADTLFVVTLLTVLGLSVNDTIVVFDRIRENLKEKISEVFSETVGVSLKQTITRSINTSLSTIIVLLALFFFGPESIKIFALTLAFGMFFGTYSSIFLASPLLVWVEKWQKR